MSSTYSLPQNDLISRTVRNFSRMGYWLTAEIEVGNQGKANRQPDLVDLLGIRFDGMFTPSRIVAECSEKESGSDTDRLLRLYGLGKYLGAHDVFFIRPKVHQNCLTLASKLNIRVIDEDALMQLESNQVTPPLCTKLSYEHLIRQNAEAEHIDEAVRTQMQQLDRYLSYGFWSVDFYRNLFILIGMYRARKHIFSSAVPASVELAFRGVERFALCLLEMARSVLSRDPESLRKLSRIYLHGGPLALRDKEKFFSLLRELTGTGEQADPPWLNEQLELLARMLCHPAGASDILRHVSVMRAFHAKQKRSEDRPAVGSSKNRASTLTKERKQSKSFLILPDQMEREVSLILPPTSIGNTKNESAENADSDEIFENIEATILAKQTAWTFCKVTGIETEIFSSLSKY